MKETQSVWENRMVCSKKSGVGWVYMACQVRPIHPTSLLFERMAPIGLGKPLGLGKLLGLGKSLTGVAG